MPSSVRLGNSPIIRPQRSLWKPTGTPKIIWPKAPRGLQVCAPLAAGFSEVARGFPATLTASPTLIGSTRGQGLKIAHGSEAVAYQLPLSLIPQAFSLECLFIDTANASNGILCGFNSVAAGSGNSSVWLHDDFSLGWAISVFDTSAKIAQGASDNIIGKVYHLVATNDGAGNLRLYTNGTLSATTTGITTLFNSYSTLYFIVGAANGASWGSGTILLCNYANVAWTASEIWPRYINPFGFLSFPEGRRHYLVGVAGGATSYTFPTAGWVWKGQAPALAFASASSQKAWHWQPNAPSIAFVIAPQQKAWRWNAQAPSLTLTISGVQKAWGWAKNAPVLNFGVAAAQAAWNWLGQNATYTGGGVISAIMAAAKGFIVSIGHLLGR